MKKQVRLIRLGTMDYQQAWDEQERLFAAKLAIKTTNRDLPVEQQQPIGHDLLLVEHPHVYTLGKSGKESHLLLDAAGLKAHEASYYRINRGGDITYHGPGQLVAYPILDLEQFKTDINWYLRSLEEVVIATMAEFSLKGERYPGYTGVWLEPESEQARKICAMGVRTSRWVTMHGIALNVNTQLDYFKHIVPCGIDDKAVASMANEKGGVLPFDAVEAAFVRQFSRVFDVELT
jgi:lipoyl(octanoyl) transferase